MSGLEALNERGPHEHLPGYLALLRAGAATEPVRTTVVTQFYRDFFAVPNTTTKRPFVTPFSSRSQSVRLINSNVAGSYAPQSIREGMPLALGVKIETELGSKGRRPVRLKSDHIGRMRDDVLEGVSVPLVQFAAFLFRDHALHLEERSLKAVEEAF